MFLKKNIKMFAWSTEGMQGISFEVTLYELPVDPTVKPIKKKRY